MDYSYRCNWIRDDLVINGNPDKPEWIAADSIELVETVSGEPPKLKTKVKLLWSNRFLYAAFYCEDDYTAATKTRYNDILYEEDVVELFFDEAADGHSYIEVEVNPLNAVLHYLIQWVSPKECLKFARLEQSVVSSVRLFEEKKKSFIEMAIPLSEFARAGSIPPQIGDRWRFNAYRIDMAEDHTMEYSAWSPTGEVNFHMPHKFGELIFDRKDKA